MDSNVVALGRMPPQVGVPNEALIQGLEDLLDKARSGYMQSLVGAGFTSDGMRISVWFDSHPDVYQMMGSLAWLQQEYANRVSEADG